MSETSPSAQSAGPRPRTLLVAAAIAAVEGMAVLVYAVSIFVAGFGGVGAIAAPFVEAVIYLVFAAGLLLVARLLLQRRRAARTPFVVAQLFALVIAYTLLSGDGDGVHAAGVVVGALGVVGLVLAFLPSTTEALDQ